MIHDNIDAIRLRAYPDERVRARLLAEELVPFTDDGSLFFATPLDDGSHKVSRVPAIPYTELRQPTPTPRERDVRRAYLELLTEVCPRLTDIARLLGVRTTQLHPLFRRLDVPLGRYRGRLREPVPDGLDTQLFRELFEDEAYTLRELADHFTLEVSAVRAIIDELELIGPTDAVKRAKRLARNPEYLEVGGRRLPPPTPVQLAAAMRDGHDTVDKLAARFEASAKTVTRWLDDAGLETPVMHKRRKARPDDLSGVVYEQVIRRRRKVPDLARELGLDRGTVWRIASGFPEWNDVNTRRKEIPDDLLGRIHHALRDKRMTHREACRLADVSHKTLQRELGRYETDRKAVTTP